MRPTVAAASVLILASLLVACGGPGSNLAKKSSPSPSPSQSAVGFTVDQTTARTISMSGGPTYGIDSQTFRLGHRYHLVYFWSCSDFTKASKFEVDLVENAARGGAAARSWGWVATARIGTARTQ